MRYLIVLLLAGCAQHQWTHPTKDQDAFNIDAMRCETLSWQVIGSDGGLARDSQRHDYRGMCMRANGWQ